MPTPRRDPFADLVEIAERRKLASQAVPVAVQHPVDIQKAVPDVPEILDVQRMDVLDSQLLRRVPRSRAGKALLTTRQPVELLEAFDFWCHKRGVDKQVILGAAIQAILDGTVKLDILDSQKPRGQPDALLMIDDVDSRSIVSHYSFWTSNPFRRSDQEALAELRKLPLLAAKCGILLAVLRCKSRVNSLRYCVQPSQEAATAAIGDLEEYLRHLERKAHRAKK